MSASTAAAPVRNMGSACWSSDQAFRYASSASSYRCAARRHPPSSAREAESSRISAARRANSTAASTSPEVLASEARRRSFGCVRDFGAVAQQPPRLAAAGEDAHHSSGLRGLPSRLGHAGQRGGTLTPRLPPDLACDVPQVACYLSGLNGAGPAGNDGLATLVRPARATLVQGRTELRERPRATRARVQARRKATASGRERWCANYRHPLARRLSRRPDR